MHWGNFCTLKKVGMNWSFVFQIGEKCEHHESDQIVCGCRRCHQMLCAECLNRPKRCPAGTLAVVRITVLYISVVKKFFDEKDKFINTGFTCLLYLKSLSIFFINFVLLLIDREHSYCDPQELAELMKEELAHLREMVEIRLPVINGLKESAEELRRSVQTLYVTDLEKLHKIRDEHVSPSLPPSAYCTFINYFKCCKYM